MMTGINGFEKGDIECTELKCPACYKVIVNPHPVKDTTETLTCAEFGCIFLSNADLISHKHCYNTIYHHKIQPDFTYNLCNKVCRLVSGLIQHYKSQHHIPSGKLVCKIFGLKCRSLAILMSHQRHQQQQGNQQ